MFSLQGWVVKKREDIAAPAVVTVDVIERRAGETLIPEHYSKLAGVNVYYTHATCSRQYREFAPVEGGFILYRDQHDLRGVFCPLDGILTLRKRPVVR